MQKTDQTKFASKYDFFVSGKWRNRDNVLKLTEKIRKKGYTAYCFLESSISKHQITDDPKKRMQEFEKLDWRKDLYIRDIFKQDILAERGSSTFVLLLPAGKSCHIEAGIAYGMGKKCILIGEQKIAESLYLIFDEVYSSEQEFLQTL